MDKTLLKIQQKNIPVNWRVERFGDVFDFLSTATYSRDILKESGEVQYLHYGDIHTKYNFHLDFTKNNLPFITEIERRNYPYMKNGDLVLADASEDYDGVGKGVEIKNLNDLRAIAGLHTFLLRDKDSNFVLGYKGFVPSCDVVREQFYRFATGTKVYSLSKESLSNVKVLIPPKEEQKAIANCLSTWDEAIEKQTKLIAAKEQRKKALMQQLLSGKKRLPGFTEDWKEVSLGKLFSERVETKREDLELLSVGQQGVYPQTESNKRDISNADKSKYKRIVPGDIGYNTMRMWQGRSALSGLEGIVSPAYTILIPRDKVDSYFFSCLFKTKKLMHLFWRNSQGLVGDTLNCKYKDFSIIKISIPSFEEQQKISTMLKNQDNEIILMKKKLDFLLGQKKGIMQKLLTGKVRLIP
jgi:type I restriction enzyme S subunit